MTTNLSPQAKEKWAEVVGCRSKPEKIKLMREFVSLCPKHKGTSRLLANVKRRIVELQEEIEKAKTHKKGGRGRSFAIPKDGAGQIVILGETNTGKSSLLSALTNANPDISPIPFTTQKPVIGMLPYEDLQFQLIEAPSIIKGASEGRMAGSQTLGLARNADGLILMVDLTRDPVAQFKIVKNELEESGILIVKPKGEVEVRKRSVGQGVQVIGGRNLVDCTVEDVQKLLKSYRVHSALVKISGRVRLDDVEDSLFSNSLYKPTLLIGNKSDLDNNGLTFNKLKENIQNRIPLLPVSSEKKTGLKKIGEQLFKMLQIIRVYCKEPSTKYPSKKPLVMRGGVKVVDVVKNLYRELYEKFKYARIWGKSVKYPGEKVGTEHEMADGDIIEIH